ncbi:response regulator [Acidiferrimicrobium sp. IK]|uniref:response regulator n=1 Tax=Acidiferrimicrobium sp. IK TaxID=2871700 RepID=UPI0021CAE60F|nr:response regulator [Acidiferrimicrobium sp. IK]MCU4186697.1 response regulator [Acidiferrimicrobium sp. IK]
MIRTLVVDDDFRVAELHAAFVERAAGFEVVGRAHTSRQALEAAVTLQPHLVLLDLYLPDLPGLELLARFRALDHAPDVIVVTAARDVATVRAAMRNGALHYLVKPFDARRLVEQLDAYRRWQADITRLAEASQDDVDRLYGRIGAPPPGPGGHSRADEPTAQLILEALRAAAEPLTANEVATAVGISRPTAQRYLAWLHEHGHVERQLRYGNAGRPSHRYSVA